MVHLEVPVGRSSNPQSHQEGLKNEHPEVGSVDLGKAPAVIAQELERDGFRDVVRFVSDLSEDETRLIRSSA